MNDDRPPVQAVLLDALGTLVELEPIAGRLSERLGIADDERLAHAVRAEISFYRRHMHEGRDEASLAGLRQRCADVLAAELGIDVPVEMLQESIRFRPFAEVEPVLREMRRRGLKLVVVSNWDVSLSQVLEDCGLAPLLDGVVTSAGVGAAKPQAEIFERALAIAGCGPESALHVGDTFDQDVVGARSAGIRALHLSRGGGGDIQGLDGLLEVLDEDGAAPSAFPPPMRPVDSVPSPPTGWGPGRVLAGIGAGILTLIAAFAVVGIILGIIDGSDTDLDDPTSLISLQAAQALIMIAIPLIFVWPGDLRARLHSLGLRRSNIPSKGVVNWRLIGIIALAELVYIVFSALLSVVLQPEQDDLVRELGFDSSVGAAIAAAILIIVLAPLSEEILFRGFVLRGLWKAMPFWVAALVGTGSWALLHLGPGNAGVVAQLTVFGLILSWLYRRTDSLWPAIALHTINNIFAFTYLVTS